MQKKRKKWDDDEDSRLRLAVETTEKGISGYWTEIAKAVPGRDGRQCRERWTYYLDTSANHKQHKWSERQDKILVMAAIKYKHRFEQIVQANFPTLQGLNAVALKNRWQCLQKRITRHGNCLILGEPSRRGRKPKMINAALLPPPVYRAEAYQMQHNDTHEQENQQVKEQVMFKQFSIPKL